jgi:hypothetical protein
MDFRIRACTERCAVCDAGVTRLLLKNGGRQPEPLRTPFPHRLGSFKWDLRLRCSPEQMGN